MFNFGILRVDGPRSRGRWCIVTYVTDAHSWFSRRLWPQRPPYDEWTLETTVEL
jgi:hypothetical protein